MHTVITFADPTGADPDVAVHIGANAVGESRLAVQIHVDELAALAELDSVNDVVHHNVFRGFFIVRGAGVGHIELFVIALDTQSLGLELKSVAVGVSGWFAERADMALLSQQGELAVGGDVPPPQIAATAAPGGPFRPKASGIESLDGRVADLVFGEALVEDEDIRVR